MSLALAPVDITVEVGVDLPCRRFDPDLWFADAPAELELAKSLCGDCPVRVECLEYALAHRVEYGVWGGASERERRRILRRRGLIATSPH